MKRPRFDINLVYEAGDLGVKGFEILFQKEIEKIIPANKSWWNYYSKSIFWDVYEIYKNKGDDIIVVLTEYWESVYNEVLINIYNRIKVLEKEIKIAIGTDYVELLGELEMLTIITGESRHCLR